MNDFTINFDKESNIPIYKQLYDYLLSEIRSGRLKENEKLPSRRSLCNHLKINKNTVEAAYQKLAVEGYIVSSPRSGFYVRTLEHINDNSEYESDMPDFKYNFSLNSIDVSRLPQEKWVKIYRDMVYENQNLFNHGENQGERVLRQEISKYIHEFRGVNCSPKNIIIGSAIDYLIMMLCSVIDENTVYGFENPCMQRPFRAVNFFKREIRILDANQNGFNVDELINSDIDVMYTMPSHQYPVGYTMDFETRKALLKWVNEKQGRYIIEDDYDCEFIFDGKPIVSIQGLQNKEDSGKVIYVGGFQRSIGPSIKTSYMILPDEILEIWNKKMQYFYYAPVSLFEQWVLAEFIEKGFFHRYIKKMKNIYMEKKNLIIKEIEKLTFSEKLTIFGDSAGTYFLLKADINASQDELIKSARAAGVKIIPLTNHFLRKSGMYNDKILIFGFGGLEDFEIIDGIKIVGKAWEKFV